MNKKYLILLLGLLCQNMSIQLLAQLIPQNFLNLSAGGAAIVTAENIPGIAPTMLFPTVISAGGAGTVFAEAIPMAVTLISAPTPIQTGTIIATNTTLEMISGGGINLSAPEYIPALSQILGSESSSNLGTPENISIQQDVAPEPVQNVLFSPIQESVTSPVLTEVASSSVIDSTKQRKTTVPAKKSRSSKEDTIKKTSQGKQLKKYLIPRKKAIGAARE